MSTRHRHFNTNVVSRPKLVRKCYLKEKFMKNFNLGSKIPFYYHIFDKNMKFKKVFIFWVRPVEVKNTVYNKALFCALNHPPDLSLVTTTFLAFAKQQVPKVYFSATNGPFSPEMDPYHA